MAMDGPKTIGDAPAFGPERSGGRCRRDPRLRGGMLSCLARNGREPRGRKSRSTALRLRRSRRSRSSARSSHQRGQVRPRAEQQSREKMAGLGSARQEVGSVRGRKRNSGRQKRHCQREKPATSAGLQHRVYALGLEINAKSSKRSEEGRDYLSLKLTALRSRWRSRRTYSITKLAKAIPCCGRGRGRTTSKAYPIKLPVGSIGQGSVKTVNRVHAVPPMKAALRQAKTSRQASEGTPTRDRTRTA